jgi:phage terminase large subunit-like protein
LAQTPQLIPQGANNWEDIIFIVFPFVEFIVYLIFGYYVKPEDIFKKKAPL